MGIISILYGVVSIFIGANLVICIKTESDYLAPLMTSIQPVTKPDTDSNLDPTIEFTLPQENADDDTLPACILRRTVSEILKPGVFSQPDPLAYFLTKANNLSEKDIRLMDFDTRFFLKTNKFPRRYIPYAKALSTLLQCLLELNHVKDSIYAIHDRLTYPSRPISPDLTVPDPELSELFSLDIFYDTDPPSRFLHKLLEIRKKRMAQVVSRLRIVLNSNSEFTATYYRYIYNISVFLADHGKDIKKLKRYISQIRSFRSSNSNVQDSNNAQV